jgi:hypothetical protein
VVPKSETFAIQRGSTKVPKNEPEYSICSKELGASHL